jgi:hypothetical protein
MAHGFTGQPTAFFQQSVFGEVSVDTTTTSTTFVDLITQNITISTNGIVLVWFSCGASNSGNNNQVIFQVTIDGVAKRGAATVAASGATDTGSAAIVLRVTGLTAGTRTVKIQWRVSAGTGRVRPATSPDTEHASLLLAEVTA